MLTGGMLRNSPRRAEVCDCPVGTIRSRVARARADLARAFQADHPGQRHLRAIS